MDRVIEVETCRIARRNGGLFLDMIIDLPMGGDYTLASLSVKNLNTNKEFELALAVSMLFEEILGLLPMSIPLSDLGETGSTIYSIFIKCTKGSNNDLTETIYVSDVEFIYDYIINKLDLSNDKCGVLPDDLILVYTILYSHTLAMGYKDIPQAVYLFNKLLHLANNCSDVNLTCNCHD